MGRQTTNSVPAFHTQLNPQWPDLKNLRARETMSKLEEEIVWLGSEEEKKSAWKGRTWQLYQAAIFNTPRRTVENPEGLWHSWKADENGENYVWRLLASSVAGWVRENRQRWSKITTGVKQGCFMSGLLFLLLAEFVIGEEHRRAEKQQRNGTRWSFTTTLGHDVFAYDIGLVSSKFEHVQNRTDRLVDNAGGMKLKLNAGKCKVIRMNTRGKTCTNWILEMRKWKT